MSRPTYSHRMGAAGALVIVCQSCGCPVVDTIAHDEHHEQIDTAAERAQMFYDQWMERLT